MSWSSASSYDSQDSSSGYNSSISGSSSSASGVDAMLQQELGQLQQAVAVNNFMLSLADVCWDKCEVKSESTLRERDRDCVHKCAGRYLDTQQFVSMRLRKLLSKE